MLNRNLIVSIQFQYQKQTADGQMAVQIYVLSFKMLEEVVYNEEELDAKQVAFVPVAASRCYK